MIYLVYLIVFLWFAYAARRTLFYLYFWQLKEYRSDRFLSSVKENKAIVFPRAIFFPALLWLSFFFVQGSSLNSSWQIAAILFYSLFGLVSLVFLFLRKWRLPKFTLKMAALCALVFLAEIILLLVCAGNFLLFILTLDIFLLLLVSLFVGIFQLPVILAKGAIEKKAAKKIQSIKNLTVVGITGSFGKTSTKEFLYTILSSKYKCLKTEGNINTKIGIAQFVLKNLEPEHQIFICEMGAYKIGEIRDICQMVKPKIGILTGINQQHLDLFGSQENIVKAKFELINVLPGSGIAIFNWDNEIIRSNVLPQGRKTRFCSVSKKIDIWSENIAVGRDNVNFKVFSKTDNPVEFKLNLLGAQNVINVLMAVACAKELGMNIEEIKTAAQMIKPGQGGMKLYKTKKGVHIIDSSYSANPDGVMAALEYLKTWPKKKILVMPSLIELGSASSEIHKNIGQAISRVCDLAIITTKEHFADIASGKQKNIFLIENVVDVADKIRKFAFEGDVVVLEGRVPPPLLKVLLD